MFSILTILCAIVTASPVKKDLTLATAALASSLSSGDAFIPITTLSKSSTKQPQSAITLKSSKDKSSDSLFDDTFEDDENEFDIEKILNDLNKFEDSIDEYDDENEFDIEKILNDLNKFEDSIDEYLSNQDEDVENTLAEYWDDIYDDILEDKKFKDAMEFYDGHYASLTDEGKEMFKKNPPDMLLGSEWLINKCYQYQHGKDEAKREEARIWLAEKVKEDKEKSLFDSIDRVSTIIKVFYKTSIVKNKNEWKWIERIRGTYSQDMARTEGIERHDFINPEDFEVKVFCMCLMQTRSET